MNVQTKRWARPLALFIALTMVMMYSFGGVALAKDADDKVHVHYKGETTDTIVVMVTVAGVQYKTDSLTSDNGNLFTGDFKENSQFPTEFKEKLDSSNTIVLLNGNTSLEMERKSSADGGGVINIWIVGYDKTEYDLSIQKTVNGNDSATVEVGQVATFEIKVTNNGPDKATGVLVEDVLPTGLDIEEITEGKGTYSTESGIWNIGDLKKKESATLTIKASSDLEDEYVNDAEIKFSPTYDNNKANDKADATLIVSNPVNPPEKEYDLVINKEANLNTVTKGSIVEFKITAKNAGNTTITGVTVADIWTDGLTDLTVVSMEGISFTTTAATGTWVIGEIGPKDIKTLEISAKASEVGTATNTAIGYLNETDSTPTNEASAVVQIINTVTPPEKTYDLVIKKDANTNTATKGSIVTFTITAKNAGNTTITGVTVADIWTDGLTNIQLVSQSGISFDTTTGIWTVGSIGPNDSDTKTLVITAKANTVGTATNTATGYLNEKETVEGVNSDTEVVEITESTLPPTPKNDLAVTKSVNLSSVTVGTGVVFTIVITNTGDTTLQFIEVKDTWPSGLTLGTATPEAGTNFTTNGNIWNVGTLAPKESKTLTIAAGTPTAGTHTNNVGIFKSGEVASPLVDDNLTNNTAAAIITVTNPTNTGNPGNPDGGRTTTTITPTPPPLAEIPETEAPLAEAPEVVLEEQPIPLADVPQTGDNTNIWLLLALMMGSGVGIVLHGRRKETVEK